MRHPLSSDADRRGAHNRLSSRHNHRYFAAISLTALLIFAGCVPKPLPEDLGSRSRTNNVKTRHHPDLQADLRVRRLAVLQIRRAFLDHHQGLPHGKSYEQVYHVRLERLEERSQSFSDERGQGFFPQARLSRSLFQQ